MKKASFVLLSMAFHFMTVPLVAQNSLFTYQGRVTDHGTNFTGNGRFKFALVTGTNVNRTATATANAPSGGYITGYAVTSGGQGYLTPPAVLVAGGGGAGASAHANISGGVVTSLTVDNTGNGAYTSAPSVTIAPPPPNIAYTTYWSNDGTSANGSEPAQFLSVPVSDGLFTIILGDTGQPNMAAVPVSLFRQQGDLKLRVWFSDGVNVFAALDPAQNLTPTPYAAFANTASNLLNGPVVQWNTNGAPNLVSGSTLNYVADGLVGATISGGGAVSYARSTFSNSVTGNFGTVGGGLQNRAGPEAFVGGGRWNIARGTDSVIGGGGNNLASGSYATIPGGQNNVASAGLSMAAGVGAQATDYGSFVWNDASGPTFGSTGANQFSVRASGGIRLAGDVSLSGGETYHHLSLSGGNSSGYLFGSYPYFGDGVHLGYNFYADSAGNPHVTNTGGGTSRITAGYGEVVLAVGGVNSGPNTVRLHATTTGVSVFGTFNNSSDRNAKENFAAISPAHILDKVLALPLSEWSYKVDSTTRHLGPMGQDFYSAFNLGTDEKHIAPVDEGGVALAAIQGLNQKLEEKTARIAELEKNVAELKRMMAAMLGPNQENTGNRK